MTGVWKKTTAAFIEILNTITEKVTEIIFNSLKTLMFVSLNLFFKSLSSQTVRCESSSFSQDCPHAERHTADA